MVQREQFRLEPLSEMLVPRDGEVYKDRWWVVTKDDELLFFHLYGGHSKRRGSPQCNRDKRLVDTLMSTYKDMFPGCYALFVPLVFLGPRDDY